MSLAAFQSVVAHLLTDPVFLDKLRRQPALLDAENRLTEVERRRVLHIASQHGLDMAARQCEQRRLDRLEATLPLTSTLMSSRAFVAQARQFWSIQPPTTDSILLEAIEFCGDLLWRQQFSTSKYLREVVSFERASLQLQLAQPKVDPVQRVNFRHDPKALLSPLMRGQMPRRVPLNPCQVIGSRDEKGKVRWQVMALREPMPEMGTDDFSPEARNSTLAPLGFD